jgi:quinol monooxygenase YgiN
MFNNEYCKVDYLEENKAVLLAWKQFSSGENYRKPANYALEQLREHKNSNFIIDARNGFEDDKADVVWAFAELIPAMAKTDCKHIIFIMNEVNEIEGEMDMWGTEFSKYFTVTRETTKEAALEKLKELTSVIWLNVIYTIQDKKREEFYQRLVEESIITESKKEAGNIAYDYYHDIKQSNRLLLVEAWDNQEAIQTHLSSSHYARLQKLKAEYVIDVVIHKFYEH